MDGPTTLLSRSRKARFFEGLGTKEVREIIGAAEIRRVPARHIIFMVGETASQLFLLLSGNAQFYRLSRDGDKVLLTGLANGDVFGLGSLLSHRVPYIGTAETTRDSEFLVWEQSSIRQLARHYPKLAENALGIILRYLAAHADRLVGLLTLNAAERLSRVVFHLSQERGTIGPRGIEIDVTNDELSQLANVGTFTVSRLLNKWARKGALAKSRGKLFICSPEKLLEK
jgi:CRP-like cAMP-binding protein